MTIKNTDFLGNTLSKIDKTKILMTKLNEGRKYCRMLSLEQGEHTAILLTCIKR